MIGAGIHDNDILVVDRSIEAISGKIVVASINAEFTVKCLKIEGGEVMLMPENSAHSPILMTDCSDFKIWGVVVHVIHSIDWWYFSKVFTRGGDVIDRNKIFL